MSDDASPPRKRKVDIQIRVDDDVACGVYANMAMVNHTDSEFTIDFIYLQPQAPLAKVRSRVITSPGHVRRLIEALQGALRKYEASHGVVRAGPEPPKGEFH